MSGPNGNATVADANGPDKAFVDGRAPKQGSFGRRERRSISAVLPAYNEEAVIERTVQHVARVIGGMTEDFELIVTNDGSRDRTGEILAEIQRDQPEIPLRVVSHERNEGYGAALASGFDAATKDLVFFTDGDKQFDVGELGVFLAAMDEHTDLVIGWRRKRADSPLRLLYARGWKTVVNGLFGYTAHDVDCAFKLFRRPVWESMTVRARGATFSAEFLVKARRLGFRVVELPVSHYPRVGGNPTGARPDVILRAFLELFDLWRNVDQQLAQDPRSLKAARRFRGARPEPTT